MTDHLKELIERAIKGLIRVPSEEETEDNFDCLYDPDDYHQVTTRQALTINGADPVLHLYSFTFDDTEIDATAEFLCALWNAYRSGSLIPSDVEGGWRTDMENAPRDGEPLFFWSEGNGWASAVFHEAEFDMQAEWEITTLDGDCIIECPPFTHWCRQSDLTPSARVPSERVEELEVENARLKEALEETEKDLIVLSGHVYDTAKTDHRWEGMYERVRSWIDRNRATLSRKGEG